MKKGLKRFLSAFLSLVIVFGLLSYLPVSSFAVTSGYYEYAVNEDGTATITDYTGVQSNLVIPSTIDGYKITSIGNWAFSGRTSLASVTIPDSVTSIGGSAFSGCTSLANVTIPEGVTSIGNDAFWRCTSLTSVTIPEGVTSIGVEVFYNCTSLTSVTIPDCGTRKDG